MTILFLVILLSSWCWPVASGAALANSQALALMELQLKWRQTFEFWTYEGDCARAERITCDANGYVTFMNLSRSGVDGDIPPTLAQLNRLIYLNLDYNNLSGSIPADLASLVNLQYMSMFKNLLSGGLPTWVNSLQSLTYLNLGVNNLAGSLPRAFGSLLDLKYLALLSNSLSGVLPSWLGNLQALTHLDIGGNSFSGSIPETLSSLTQLVYLRLMNNTLAGAIPSGLGAISPLRDLILSYNRFSGPIPPSLGNMTGLTRIDLKENNLSGSIPETLSSLTQLVYMRLMNNTLEGEIPSALAGITPLSYLILSYNRFSGPIPPWLGSVTGLLQLDICGNNLTGPIPDSLSNLTQLQILLLPENNLSGTIPQFLGNLKQLIALSLSENQLSGSLPSTLSSLTGLQGLSFQFNNLNGSIPSGLGNLKALASLFLRNNSLTGAIPSSLGMLTDLTELWLDGNKLSGSFPTTFINLNKLAVLTVDKSIQCPLPSNSCITRPPAGGLAGFCKLQCRSFCSACYQGEPVSPKVPSPPIDNVNKTNGTINPPLPIDNNSTNKDGGTSPPPSNRTNGSGTTPPSNSTNSGETTPPPPSNITSDGSSGGSSAMSTGALVGIVCGAVGAIALVSFLVLCICKQRNSRINHGKHKEDVEGGPASRGEDCCGSKEAGQPLHQDSVAWVAQLFRPMTLAELRKATNNFSEKRLLGRGGFGAVYLGHGPGGQKWAVKRSIKTGSRVDDAFKQEVLKLSRLTNPHLVSLLGFCIEKKEQIVVYEFAENGSLRTAVHESSRPLSFEQRLTIACGVVRGLNFLHDQKPPIVHRDIKPDNILLDAQWQAKLADFGLLRALDGQQTIYTLGAGTPGYIDPEYWTSLRLTTASDVYSFGMVLLEMFTGRNLLVDSQQDLQHAGELQPTQNPMPVPIPLGIESSTQSSSSNSGTGQNSLSSTNTESTSITSSSGAGLTLGKRNPFYPERQQEGIPLRKWVVSIQERYHGQGTTWLSVVLDPSLQPDYLPENVVEKVLQIGIDCSAQDSSSRPDIRIVEEGLLKLAAQLESRGM